MLVSYLKLQQIFDERNLSNHKGEIKYELINNGTGFRIWVNDWVVFFNEYGTGIYNASPKGLMAKKVPWTYFKDGKFTTTYGQKPKFMFGDLKKEILYTAGSMYRASIGSAINQTSYEQFASIADGSIRL